MPQSFETHIAHQDLRKAVYSAVLSHPLLAPDLRRNFDGSPNTQAQWRANKLTDTVLDVVLRGDGGIAVDVMKTRVTDPGFGGSLGARFASLKGSPPFSATQPNADAVNGLVKNIRSLLTDLKVLANGEIVNMSAPTTETAAPAKTLAPKKRSENPDAQPPVDDAVLRTTIAAFFEKHPAVLDAGKGRPAFGLTLENRVKGLTDTAMLVLAGKEGGTLGGWKANLTHMGKPGSTLELALHHEIATNRGRYPQGFFYSPSQGVGVNDTPARLSNELCTHLQQWMKVEQTKAAAIDADAPKAADLAAKINGKGNDGRAA